MSSFAIPWRWQDVPLCTACGSRQYLEHNKDAEYCFLWSWGYNTLCKWCSANKRGELDAETPDGLTQRWQALIHADTLPPTYELVLEIYLHMLEQDRRPGAVGEGGLKKTIQRQDVITPGVMECACMYCQRMQACIRHKETWLQVWDQDLTNVLNGEVNS